MSEKGIPEFDGRGDAYWWLIQLDRFFEAKNWIHDEMKVMWVTLFALRGEAFKWWSSWKQDHQNATWEIFERGFIQEFIPDLWEMLQAAEGEERGSRDHDLNEIAEKNEESKDGDEGTNSGSMQISKPLDADLYATVVKAKEVASDSEAEKRMLPYGFSANSRRENHGSFVIRDPDGWVPSGRPRTLETGSGSKNQPRPKSNGSFGSYPNRTQSGVLPAPEPRDRGPLAMTFPRPIPPPKPPDSDPPALALPEPEPPDTGKPSALCPQPEPSFAMPLAINVGVLRDAPWVKPPSSPALRVTGPPATAFPRLDPPDASLHEVYFVGTDIRSAEGKNQRRGRSGSSYRATTFPIQTTVPYLSPEQRPEPSDLQRLFEMKSLPHEYLLMCGSSSKATIVGQVSPSFSVTKSLWVRISFQCCEFSVKATIKEERADWVLHKMGLCVDLLGQAQIYFIIWAQFRKRILPMAIFNACPSRWAIETRVTARWDMCRCNSALANGKVFSFYLFGYYEGEVQIASFSVVIDRFEGTVKVGKIYLISKLSLQSVRMNFSQLNNVLEILLDQHSTVKPYLDIDGFIHGQQLSLKVLVLFESIGGSERSTIGDIVDHFLRRKFGSDSYERIDKDLLPAKMQAALKKFSSQNNGSFVFLLETCACLPNIKLSSIDTIVIFGSDWNPLVLANDIANDVFMLLGLVVEAEFDILDAPNELALVLAQAVTVGLLLTHCLAINLEEINNSLPPKCRRSEVVWMARSLEADMFSSQQWDPGENDVVFCYCCISGVLTNKGIVDAYGAWSLYFKLWDPGELKFPMVATCCCWSGLLIFHGLFNFVFDRGKMRCGGQVWQLVMQIPALRTRLFFKRWVVLGTGLGLSPSNGLSREVRNYGLTWQLVGECKEVIKEEMDRGSYHSVIW